MYKRLKSNHGTDLIISIISFILAVKWTETQKNKRNHYDINICS